MKQLIKLGCCLLFSHCAAIDPAAIFPYWFLPKRGVRKFNENVPVNNAVIMSRHRKSRNILMVVFII